MPLNVLTPKETHTLAPSARDTGVTTIEAPATSGCETQGAIATIIGTQDNQGVLSSHSAGGLHRSHAPWKSTLVRLIPGLLGSALYLLNNLDVIHGLIAPPPGYAPLGVQRSSDIAQYLTWLVGLEKAWALPNYHAPWATSPGFLVPGLLPLAILERFVPLNPVVALQLFSLTGYICTSYALAFAYRTFCQTRRQAFWSLLIAFMCVPVGSLPGLFGLTRGHWLFTDSAGAVEFIYTSEGFLHGLGTWVFTTYGTCAQVLAMALLARYGKSQERRWLGWLAVVCLLSALIHPFEVFLTVAVAAVVLLREPGLIARKLANLSVVLLGATAGLSPYVIQSLRVAWLHEVETANGHLVSIMPAPLMAMVGLPTILVIVLLLFGLPNSQKPTVVILETWFVCTFFVFYLPGVPFAMHILDGLFFAVGLLLTIQIAELLSRQPSLSKSPLRFLVVPIMIWALFPQVIFRLRAWKDGNDIKGNEFPFSSAIAPIDESVTVEWLRKNASPSDLVLATEDAAPWIATAPIHSFASHYIFSLQKARPRDAILRNAFYDGTLTLPSARVFLETLGVRFVIVPDESRARLYLDNATLRARFSNTAIYELPGGRMKPYRDSRIVAMGTSLE